MLKIKKILLFIFAMFAAISLSAQSSNIMKLLPAVGLPGSPIVMEIEIINDDPFAALQFDILLPAGFTYVPNSAVLTTRSDGHIPQGSVLDAGARFRGGAFAFPTKNFLGNSGVVYRFTLNTPETPGVYPVPFSTVAGQTPRITTASGVNVITGWIDGSVTLCAPVNLAVPEAQEESACQSQEAINAAFELWLASVEFSGGCSPTLTTEPAVPEAPSACGGSVQVTWTLSSAAQADETGSSTFSVAFPLAVNLTVPENYNGTTCMTSQQITNAFAAWVAGAGFTGGCEGVLTMSPANPEPPDFCGGSITVQWTVSSACEVDVVKSASFTIPNAPAVDLTVPEAETIGSCLTQNEVDAAFAAWLLEAGFEGGCGAAMSNDATDAPSYCGGSVTVNWKVESDCQADVIKSATFTVTGAPLVNLNVPGNFTSTPCEFGSQEAADAALVNWLSQAGFTGGCGGVMTKEPVSPVAPGYCEGGSITVTWIVSSDCQSDVTKSATFTLLAALKGDVNCDGDINIDDIVLVVNNIFFEEPLPCSSAGDVDNDGFITTDDLVQIVNIVFP